MEIKKLITAVMLMLMLAFLVGMVIPPVVPPAPVQIVGFGMERG